MFLSSGHNQIARYVSRTVVEVLVCVFAALSEQIKVSVMGGQRPDLEQIEGPEHFVEFVKMCMVKCWDGEPRQRPTSGCEILTLCSVFMLVIVAAAG